MKVQILLKAAIVLLGLFLFRTNAETPQTQSITIVIDDAYEPFSYAFNGEPRGLYVDILQAISQNLPGFDIKLKAVPWERGKMMMKNGKELGLAPAYFHGHDWDYLYPYSIPLMREQVALLCHSDLSQLESKEWPEDFTDLSIGNMRGFDGWGGMEFHKLVADRKIFYRELSSAEQLILMAAKRRLDCILMEEFAFAWNIKNLKNSKQLSNTDPLPLRKVKIVGSDYSYIGYSEVAILSGNFPSQYQFRKAFDSTLYKMQKSGELQRVIEAAKRRYAGDPLDTPCN